MIWSAIVDSICFVTVAGIFRYKTKFVITVEDGIINGGYGQKVASYLSKYKIPTLILGVDNEFVDMDQVQNIYKKYNLSADELLKIVESLIK